MSISSKIMQESQRLWQLKSLLRLTPFDVNTPEGRSQERHRRIALTALASAAAKSITIATSLITVPLTLNYLGGERYGLWMTISSVIAMMVFADFGIGNGLMNAIVEAYGIDDKNAIKTHVANAMVILWIIAITILAVFFALYSFVQWGAFFNVRTPLAIQESGPALAVFMVCFALGVPAGIVQRVQMGLQQGFETSLWQAGGSILGLLLVLLVISMDGGLPWLVLALAGAPIAVLALNSAIFFFVQRRDLVPQLGNVSRTGLNLILHSGILFFVLQVAVSAAYASDNIIIAKVLGADAVAQYSVVSKLFEGVLMVIGLAFAPLWPAYGEAKARRDSLWIKKTLYRSLWVTLIIVLGAVITLVAFYKPIFALWVGEEHVFSFSLVACYAVWTIIKGLGGTYSMFLNGMQILKVQLIIAPVFALVSVVAKIALAFSFGLNGILYAMVLTYIITTVIPYSVITKKLLPK